ncbi:MAG: hypothetical protein KDC24_13620 [Saprospiraceae bacterium]|nr:hypothetical protein [Saprospiraceae bacterium]
MRKIVLFGFLFLAGSLLMAFAMPTSSNISTDRLVATGSKGNYQLRVEALNKKTPGGLTITSFRLIHSKDKSSFFLVQEVKAKEGKFNRYIPLKQVKGGLSADFSRPSGFVDCWLMTCSTCDEEVTNSGAVFCSCSVGGCENADTSDPVKDIAETLMM